MITSQLYSTLNIITEPLVQNLKNPRPHTWCDCKNVTKRNVNIEIFPLKNLIYNFSLNQKF